MPRHAGCLDGAEFQRDDPCVSAGRLYGSYVDADGVNASEFECAAGQGKSDISFDFDLQRRTARARQRHRRLEHQLYERRSLVHLDVVLQSLVLQRGKMSRLHPEPTQTRFCR